MPFYECSVKFILLRSNLTKSTKTKLTRIGDTLKNVLLIIIFLKGRIFKLLKEMGINYNDKYKTKHKNINTKTKIHVTEKNKSKGIFENILYKFIQKEL